MRSRSVPVSFDEISFLGLSPVLEVPTPAVEGSQAWGFPHSKQVGQGVSAGGCPGWGPSWTPEKGKERRGLRVPWAECWGSWGRVGREGKQPPVSALPLPRTSSQVDCTIAMTLPPEGPLFFLFLSLSRSLSLNPKSLCLSGVRQTAI